VHVSALTEERTLGATQHSCQTRDTVYPGKLSHRVLLGIPPPPLPLPHLPHLSTAAPCPLRVVADRVRVDFWGLVLFGASFLSVVHQGVVLLAQHQLLDELVPIPAGKLVSGLYCLAKGLIIRTVAISNDSPEAKLVQKMRRHAVKLGGVGWAQYGLKDVNHSSVGLPGQDNRLGVQYTTSLAGTLCGKECVRHDSQPTNSRSQSSVVVTSARGTRYAHDTEGQDW